MANLARALKDEIVRLARKEIKPVAASLKKESVALKRSIADLRRRVAQLEKGTRKLLKESAKSGPAAEVAADDEASSARITAKMIVAIRERLDLTQAQLGELAGVGGQTVYMWETKKGRLKFRGDTKARLVHLRGLKKAEVAEKLKK